MIKQLVAAGTTACLGLVLIAGVRAQPCADTTLSPVKLDFTSRTGTATLVGFEEFISPSLPPKKYRRLATFSETPFFVCGPMNGDCTGPTCPSSVSFSFKGTVPGQVYTFTVTGSFVLQGVSGGTATYRAIGLSAFREPWDQNDVREALAVRINGDVFGADFQATNGQTIHLPSGGQGALSIQINYVSWTPVAHACFSSGPASLPLQADAWNSVAQYAASTGVLQRFDNSTRMLGTGPLCSVPGGSTTAIPCATPFQCYGGGASIATSRLVRTTTGLGCVPIGDGKFRNYSGVVVESLEDEDRDEDAEARAAAVTATTTVAPPAYRTARTTGFSFEFSQVRYRGLFNISCAGEYDVILHYTEKAHHSTGEGQLRTKVVRQHLETGMQMVEGEVPVAEKNMDYTVVRLEATLACDDDIPGNRRFELGSIKARFSLGSEGRDQPAGAIFLRTATMSPAVYAPEALLLSLPESPAFEAIHAEGRLRQVRAPYTLVDVVVTGDDAYELRFYPRSQVGEVDPVTRLHPVSGNPHVVYRFDNPDAPEDEVSRLRITETRGGSSQETIYACDPEGTWSQTEGSGQRRTTEATVVVDDLTTKTVTVRDADDAIVTRVARTYQRFAWGEERVREVLDPDGAALATSYEFYDDVPETDPNYRRLKQQTNGDGSWERFTYAVNGSVRKSTRPFLNAPPTTTDEALCRVTDIVEDTIPDADGDTLPESRTTTIVRTLGEEAARRYLIRWSAPVTLGGETCQRETEAICIAAGAAWDAPTNLVTETLTAREGPSHERVRRLMRPDGTATIRRVLVDGGNIVTTIEAGAPDSAREAITDGQRRVTVTNAAGAEVSETVSDVASGLTLEAWAVTEFDAFQRPTRIDYEDGTFTTRTYACCGLASETDRSGVETTYEYDAFGRQVRMTRHGISTLTTYDADGQVLAVIRRGTDGTEIRQETNRYDVAGRRVESRDALDRVTTFAETLDPVTGGLIRTTTFPDGGTSVERFARDGSRLGVEGTAVSPHRYEYGVDHGVEFVKDISVGEGEGVSTFTEWVMTRTDFAGRPFQVVHADGSASAVEFNAAGQPVRIVDPDGVTTLFVYTPRGERAITAVDVNQNGGIDFEGADRIMRATETVVERDGVVVNRHTTDVWATEGSDTPRTIATVDQSADGRRSWQTERGLTTTTTAIGDGQGGATITTTNPAGVVTRQIFRGARLESTRVTSADDRQISFVTHEYDAHGRLARTIDARGGVTTFTYFSDDQVETVTSVDPDPERTGAGYDPQIVSYTYDASGRLTTVRDPDGGLSHTTYWPGGKTKRTWGTRTYPAEFTYDPQGRLKTLTTWQDFGADTGQAVTTFAYDPQRGFLQQKRYADGTGPRYEYTPGGRLRTRIAARTPEPRVVYEYDGAGELTRTDYSDATADFALEYDRLGRPKSVQDAAGSRLLEYDEATGLVRHETYGSGLLSGVVITRDYDAWQRLSGIELTSDGDRVNAVQYGYDGASRIEMITAGAHVAQYTYGTDVPTVESLVFRTAGVTRLTSTRSHDALGRLTSITHASSSAPDVGYHYTYNAANQRERATRQDGSYWDLGYDDLGQLVSSRQFLADGVAVPGREFAWSFDDIGNRRSATTNGAIATYQPDLLNQYARRTVPGVIDVSGAAAPGITVTVSRDGQPPQGVTRQDETFYRQLPVDNTSTGRGANLRITAVRSLAGPAGEDAVTTADVTATVPQSPESFRHDADGNLVEDGRWSYEWDAENRLVAMNSKRVDPASGSEAERRLEFVYDGQGRRVVKRTLARVADEWSLERETRFVYDGWNLLAELDTAGAASRTYVWGLDLSGSSQGAGGVGGLIGVTDVPADHTLFVAFDGNGNVGALVSAADGTLAARYDYSGFGERVVTEGPFAAANPFGFSTKYTDPETGHLYFGLRSYDPGTGRWLSRDPIEEEGGNNLYQFTANAPTVWTDPIGLALYAFDGTNNDGERDRWDNQDAENGPTNVKILYDIYAGNRYYAHGVGTRDGILNVFGLAGGLRGKARQAGAMRAAKEFVARGDLVADIIGFSRGAAQARDFANQLAAHFPCVTIRWIGLFDTVASFGYGGNDIDIGYNFRLPSQVKSAFHLTAGGERRKFFPLMSIRPGPGLATARRNFSEIEIPGAAHSDIGGGYRDGRELGNFALGAMWRDGRRRGVPFGEIPVMYRVLGGKPHDSRWVNDKVVEFLRGTPRVRKIFYAP